MSQAFHDHFSAVARRYADFRPQYPPALFDYLATLVPRNELIWDCAAGNGQATVDLAQRFDQVIATDASQEQINSAKPRPNIEYRVAPAEASDLEPESIGLITVAQALHWFDFDRFYAEARRVLKPKGFLAAWCYGINAVEGSEVNRVVDHFYHAIVGPYWPPERKLLEEGYRTIPFPFPEMVAPPFHMEARWTLEELLGYFSTWSATNRYLAATGRNPLEPLSVELARVWGDPAKPRTITWPMAMRVGRRKD